MQEIRVGEIDITPVKPRRGLLGFASFVLNGFFYIGNVAIRSRLDGGIRLTYPDRILANGQRIAICHPISKEAGSLIEQQVLRVYQNLLKEVRQEMESEAS